jgi:hypothetical protein
MRDKALVLACQCLFVPYIWGGNSPETGLDCSGFVIWVLNKIGLLPDGFDTNAQGLFRRWEEYKVEAPVPGCLIFYGTTQPSLRIVHVMLAVNPVGCIGAVRGNNTCTSVEIADSRFARVDARLIDYRADRVAIVDPFKELEQTV